MAKKIQAGDEIILSALSNGNEGKGFSLIGDRLLSKEAKMHPFIVLAGCSCVGKSTIRRKLMQMFPGLYFFLRKYSCRKFRLRESQKNFRHVDPEQMQNLIENSSGLLSMTMDLDFYLLPKSVTDYLEKKYGISAPNPYEEISGMDFYQYFGFFQIRNLEKLVKRANNQGRRIIVELSINDAISWKQLFPKSLIFWISTNSDLLTKRFWQREEEKSHYSEVRLAQSLLETQFPPKAIRKAALNSTPIKNDNKEDINRIVAAIDFVAHSD